MIDLRKPVTMPMWIYLGFIAAAWLNVGIFLWDQAQYYWWYIPMKQCAKAHNHHCRIHGADVYITYRGEK